jgi:hypothetical protein
MNKVNSRNGTAGSVCRIRQMSTNMHIAYLNLLAATCRFSDIHLRVLLPSTTYREGRPSVTFITRSYGNFRKFCGEILLKETDISND